MVKNKFKGKLNINFNLKFMYFGIIMIMIIFVSSIFIFSNLDNNTNIVVNVDDTDNNTTNNTNTTTDNTTIPDVISSFNYNFLEPTNYIYDTSKIDIFNGYSKLSIQDASYANYHLNEIYNERPDNETFYANYETDMNATYADGSLIGIAYGNANVSNEELNLTNNDVSYVDYNATFNADSIQTGCIRFNMIPNYNIGPASEGQFFTIAKENNDLDNLIFMRHSTGGALRLHMYSSTGSLIQEIYLGTFSATLGQEYIFEINYNLNIGETRVFIDGIQKGTTATATGTRDSNIGLLRIGSDWDHSQPSNFKIDNFAVFSSVQHISNYEFPEINPRQIVDSSGNNRHGISKYMENDDWSNSKINNGVALDGINDNIDLGDICDFEYTDKFSVSGWFKSDVSGTSKTIISKQDNSFPNKGWNFYIDPLDHLNVYLGTSVGTNRIIVNGLTDVVDNIWHNVIFTYDGSGLANGIQLYVDNVLETMNIISDTLNHRSILSSSNCTIGSRVDSLFLEGILDEISIFNSSLSIESINSLWNSGSGTEEEDLGNYYLSSSPTVETVSSSDLDLDSYVEFIETALIPVGTEIKYLLSNNDGISWLYWDSIWLISDGLYSQTSNSSIINASISDFPIINHKIRIKIFLYSIGDNTPILSNIEIKYKEV